MAAIVPRSFLHVPNVAQHSLAHRVPWPAIVKRARAKCTVQGLSRQRQPLTTTLPNGLRVAYFNRTELDLLYDEILGQCSYLANGVCLMPGDTVVDVGANIGLFSLLSAQAVGPQGVVVAVEPLPEARHAAQLNAASLQTWCQGSCCTPTLVGAAVGAESRPCVEMTAYDWALGWSSLSPDDDEVRANMSAYLDQLLSMPDIMMMHGAVQGSQDDSNKQGETGLPSLLEGNVLVKAGRLLRQVPLAFPLSRALEHMAVELMLRSRRTVAVPQITVSDLIRDCELERVDLLKVDAERAELDVLRGIRDEDWHKIRQLSLEVHDIACDDHDASLGTIGRASGKPEPRSTSPSDFQKTSSASSLAFLGDAIWTVHMRQNSLLPPKHVQAYRQAADQQVVAESQARLYDLLLEWSQEHHTASHTYRSHGPGMACQQPGPPPVQPGCVVTSEEVSLLKWASSEQPGLMYRGRFRRSPKAQTVYRKATAFEALLGYLQLTQPDRLQSLCACLKHHLHVNVQGES